MIHAAVECNRFATQPIHLNRPDTPPVDLKLDLVPTSEILKAFELAPEETTVVTGGPSCRLAESSPA